MPYNSNFSYDSNDINSFKSDGFLLLKNIFTRAFIDQLKSATSKSVMAPTGNYGKGFSKLKYGTPETDELVYSLISEPKFRKLMLDLCGQPVFYNLGLGFELKREISQGFPYHVGTQSFGYQPKEQFGCTIWVPLTPINPDNQRGGMKYIPKNKLSGAFMYDYINLVTEYIKSKKHNPTFEDFDEIKNSLLNSGALKKILDFIAVEDKFEPGDALIFEKNVLHTSVPLLDGEIDSRLALAMRFSSVESTYDAERVDKLEYPRRTFNYDGSTSFNLDVAMPEGRRIIDSPFFASTKDIRIIE